VKRAVLVAPLLGLFACGSPKPATKPDGAPPVETWAPRPAWVQARPVDNAYYIGVGLASKARPDHQEAAKKNALNDLASEISVTVEGNSLLHTLDQRTRFDETFTSTIRTTTNEQIEGFEVVDTWENASEYWTWYRLSKAAHARIKAERKARAIGTATDLHARALESRAKGDLRSAVDQELRALLAMKDHWGENDLVDLGGRQVPLVNELYAELQRTTGGVYFDILPERCELGYANRYKREMLVSAFFREGRAARDLPQLPLAIEYPGAGGKVTELKSTDGEGRARTVVQRVDMEAAGREFIVRLHLDALVSKELDQALVKPLLAGLTVPERRAPITVTMPRVFMRAQETNLGQPVGDAGLAVVVREELTRKGFRFVEREADADMLLNLNAATRQGGESNGFYTAFLDVVFSFRDRRTGDTLHEGGRQGVKGVQLDHQRAGLDAYKKAVQDVRKELVPAMMEAIR